MNQILLTLLLIYAFPSLGQSFNEDNIALSNFFKRMYNVKPFEGVKVVEDYDHHYFLSVISLETAKYNNPSTMIRVTQVKAQSQANVFFNGSIITTDLVITTKEQKNNDFNNTVVETIESIKEGSIGFVQGMQLLVNFDNSDSKRMVFVFFKEIHTEPKTK